MTAPERIWRDAPTTRRGYMHGLPSWPNESDASDGASEYILHTRAALAASPLVQEIVAEAVNEALDDVTTMHRVIADVRMATVGSKPMLSELAAALVAWRAEAVKAEREACAQVADDLALDRWREYKDRMSIYCASTHHEGMSDGASDVATAIRARGEV